MLRKEFRELLIPTALRLSIILLPVVFSVVMDFGNFSLEKNLVVVWIFWGIAGIWIANYYGTHIFHSEFRDHALEYMLTFPVSRSRLFFYKLIPRLSLLGILIGIFELMGLLLFLNVANHINETIYFAAFLGYPLWILFFLFCGFCIGMVEDRNWRAVVNLGIMIAFFLISIGIGRFIFHQGLANIRVAANLGSSLGCLVVKAILLTAFVSIVRKFDLKALALYKKRFSIRALPPLIILAGIGIAIMVLY